MSKSEETLGVLLIDAFSNQAYAGNPAGVVLQAEGLSDSAMLKVAREINASETAFAVGVGPKHVRLRYFTPRCEVNYCGHATVAALSARSGAARVA